MDSKRMEGGQEKSHEDKEPSKPEEEGVTKTGEGEPKPPQRNYYQGPLPQPVYGYAGYPQQWPSQLPTMPQPAYDYHYGYVNIIKKR